MWYVFKLLQVIIIGIDVENFTRTREKYKKDQPVIYNILLKENRLCLNEYIERTIVVSTWPYLLFSL